MTAQSPSAYLSSIGLHALVVLLVALAMGLSRRAPSDSLQVFELVAGEGNNYGALVAPKLGDPQAAPSAEQMVSLPVPVPPVRTPDPEPAIAPAAEVPPPPVQATVPEPVRASPAATKAPAVTPPPNFVRDIKRLSEKRAANIEKKFKAEQKAAAERARKEAELEAKRMTKADFDRLNAKGKTPPSSTKGGTVKVPSVSQGIRGGVAGGSAANREGGAGGTALERAEQDLTEAYISLIIQRIRQSLEKAAFSAELSVRLQISVSSGGTLSGVKTLGTSGNAEFDQAVLEAVRSIGDLGPPPNRKGETFIFKVVAQDLSP